MKNIHLIKSDYFSLTNSLIDELLTDYQDINKYDLDEVEINDVINDSSYYGLFNDKKAIIINNVKYFGGKFLYEEETSLLYDYLSNVDDNYIIIFICNDISDKKEFTTKVVNLGATIHDLSSLSEDELYEFINKYLDNHNIKMEKNSISYLLSRVDNNLDIFISEVDKMSIITNNITDDTIDVYSSYNKDDDAMEFKNAITAKNFDKGFTELDKLLKSKDDVISLVGLLANNYALMYIVKDCMDNNLSDDDICKLNNIKSGRLYYLKKDLRIYTKDELKDIIIGLSEVDKKIKTGSDPVYVFKEFLLNI